jgi:hypothetical protein
MNETCARCGSIKIDGHMMTETVAACWCDDCGFTWYEDDVGI